MLLWQDGLRLRRIDVHLYVFLQEEPLLHQHLRGRLDLAHVIRLAGIALLERRAPVQFFWHVFDADLVRIARVENGALVVVAELPTAERGTFDTVAGDKLESFNLIPVRTAGAPSSIAGPAQGTIVIEVA